MNRAIEDLQAGDNTGNPEFFHGCARFSLWLPIIAGVFCKGVMMAIEGVEGDARRWISVAAGAVFILLILASLVLAIIALSGIPRVGSEGIPSRAISGLLLSLFLLFCFGTGFYRARQIHVLARTLDQSRKTMESDMAKDVDEGKGLLPDKQAGRLEGFKQALDSTSQNASGNTALYARAASALFGRMQVEMKKYAVAVQPIADGSALDVSQVTQREQLDAKKAQVRAFLAANEKYLLFVTNGESVIKEELLKQPLSPEARDAALKEFHRTAAPQVPIQERIRNDDRRCGVAILGILDLLDENWDKWSFDGQQKKIVFMDDTVREKYLAYQDEIRSAAREQTQYQKQLLNLNAQ